MADLTNPTNNSLQPSVAPSPQEAITQSTPKRSYGIAAIIIALVIGAIVGAGGAGGYILANQGTLQLTSKDTTNQATTATPTPSPPTPTPTPDPTAGWKTYTHKDGKYSFKYPADWQLSETQVRDPYTLTNTREYEYIKLSANGHEIVEVYYPFELIGCGQTTTKAYIFGDKAVTMTADCESQFHLGFFASPYLNGSTDDKTEPRLVVGFHYAAEHNEELHTFSGIKP